MRVLGAAAAYACAEGLFYCWSSCKRASLAERAPPYIEAPSGRAFTSKWRRREVERILATEFGATEAEGGGETRTPERGRAWLSGWFFDAPFESIRREQAAAFLAWAYYNYESNDALSPAEADEIEADLARFEQLGRSTLGSAPPSPPPSACEACFCMRPGADDPAPFGAHRP
eukprot:2194031-Prymnesium_polylepis.1